MNSTTRFALSASTKRPHLIGILAVLTLLAMPLWAALNLHFIGGEIGQGFPGDEDNAVAHPSTSLSQNEFRGNATIEFAMGATASTWGTAAADAPPSPTVGIDVPAGTVDVTGAGNFSGTSGANVANMIDNNSDTSATVVSNSQLLWNGNAQRVSSYTITSGKQAGDATDWTLDGSNDGRNWTTLDCRQSQVFQYRQQTRPFLVQTPASFSRYRLSFSGGTADNCVVSRGRAARADADLGKNG